MAFYSVPAPMASGNSYVRLNSRSGAISMLRDELSAAAVVIAAEVAAMDGDPALAELAAIRNEQLGRIAFLLEATFTMRVNAALKHPGWIKRGIAKLRDRLAAMAPFWDYGRTEIDRLDMSGSGPGRFFEIQWLGLKATIFAGRTPPPLRGFLE